MRALLSALAFAAAFITLAQAERTHTTVRGRQTRHVKAVGCKDLCLFENDDNSWCFLLDPPALRLGWQWSQTFGDESYSNAKKYY